MVNEALLQGMIYELLSAVKQQNELILRYCVEKMRADIQSPPQATVPNLWTPLNKEVFNDRHDTPAERTVVETAPDLDDSEFGPAGL